MFSSNINQSQNPHNLHHLAGRKKKPFESKNKKCLKKGIVAGKPIISKGNLSKKYIKNLVLVATKNPICLQLSRFQDTTSETITDTPGSSAILPAKVESANTGDEIVSEIQTGQKFDSQEQPTIPGPFTDTNSVAANQQSKSLEKQPDKETIAPNSNSIIKINLLKESPQKAGPVKNPAMSHLYKPSNYPKGIPKSFIKSQKEQDSQRNLESKQVQKDASSWSTVGPMMEPNKSTLASNTPNEIQKIANEPIFIETENQSEVPQPYSPSDVYNELSYEENITEDDPSAPESSEGQSAQKRLSAFQRLGPVFQPKKPKLTISLMLNKEKAVREVIDSTNEDTQKYTPVHLRQAVINSTDETVMKYLPFWPWKKSVALRKTVTARQSKTVMILEQEQMEEIYDRDNVFIQVSVRGYPKTWNKEDVLDALLNEVKGKSFIPCFTEFTEAECKFLVLRNRAALVAIHKIGFVLRKDNLMLKIVISLTNLSLSQIDFIPRLMLRKRVSMEYDGERKLNLSEFTLKDDISNFFYFPLNRPYNQTELIQLQNTVAWEYLTDLDLSRNKLTSINNLELASTTPKLKNLNLSYNCFEKVTFLLTCKTLSLHSLRLEGNPLCHNYIDPDLYIKVVKMMFPSVTEIDGIKIILSGELPPLKRNYCPGDAVQVVDKFLEVYFPLMDTTIEDRSLVQNLYAEKAIMTITHSKKIRHSPIYKSFRDLFLRSRCFDEGELDSVVNATSIVKLINKWPEFEHDPFTFTVDVLHHADFNTVLRVGGILKLKAKSLANDEYLVAFTRTFVLCTNNGTEYKIQNEMIYWNEPTEEYAATAFRVTTVQTKKLNLKFESTPSENMKKELLEIFMKLTTLDKIPSERCLELKNWNMQQALDYFTKLLKLDSIENLKRLPEFKA